MNDRKRLKKREERSYGEINKNQLTEKDLKVPKRTINLLLTPMKKKNAYKISRKIKSTTSDR